MRVRKSSILFSIGLVIIIVASSLMVACAKPAAAPTSAAPTAPPQPAAKMTDLRILGSSVGSSGYVMASIISAMLATYSKTLRGTPIPSPGWVDATRLLAQGMGDISTVGGRETTAMMNGAEPFVGQKYTGFKWLFPYVVTPNVIVSKVGSPFRTLQDLKEARVASPALGTAAEAGARDLFKVLGFQPKKIVYLSPADASSALKDNTVDVAYLSQGIGAPVLIDFFALNDSYFIQMDDETWKKLDALKTGYMRVTLPAKTYRLQDKDVSTMGWSGYVMATDRMSDETVYEILRTFWDEIKNTTTMNPTVVGEAVRSVKSSLFLDPGPSPMHPGALKYFKEKGMLK